MVFHSEVHCHEHTCRLSPWASRIVTLSVLSNQNGWWWCRFPARSTPYNTVLCIPRQTLHLTEKSSIVSVRRFQSSNRSRKYAASRRENHVFVRQITSTNPNTLDEHCVNVFHLADHDVSVLDPWQERFPRKVRLHECNAHHRLVCTPSFRCPWVVSTDLPSGRVINSSEFTNLVQNNNMSSRSRRARQRCRAALLELVEGLPKGNPPSSPQTRWAGVQYSGNQ